MGFIAQSFLINLQFTQKCRW